MMPADVLMVDVMLLLPCWLRSIKGLTVSPTDLSLSPCSSGDPSGVLLPLLSYHANLFHALVFTQTRSPL